MRPGRRPAACLLTAALCACGPSPEGLVDDLGDPVRREAARQELLLAKDRAVPALLAALEEARPPTDRLAIVEVLAGLMTRVDDERVAATLADRLRHDRDPAIRARVAHFAAVHRRPELVEPLLDALEDTDGDVRHEALLALGSIESRLGEVQSQVLADHLQAFLDDPHPGVRMEARIRAETEAGILLQAAERAVLEARLAEAESLFSDVIARYPFSRRARYREARYYYDNGQVEAGLQRLRDSGMLLDVPRLARAPVIDGRLDDEIWAEAARADSFYQFSFQHPAALPAEHVSTLWVGYTDRALFIGFRGEDAHPDSLVARFTEADATAADAYRGGPVGDHSIWRDDIVELFLDADFDHSDYAHIGINSNAVRVDEWIRGAPQTIAAGGGDPSSWNDAAWRVDDAVAAHVGADHWSLEYRLRFGGDELPAPQPGSVWGFNLVRVFRGEEYAQWVRTYSGGHSPNDFGVLRFR